MESPVENDLWAELMTDCNDVFSREKVQALVEKVTNWPYFISKVLRENSAHINCRAAEALGIFQNLPDDVQAILNGRHILTGKPYERLGSERQLLKLLCRMELEHKALEQVQELLRKDLDWGYLFRLVCAHDVVPLVHEHLKQADCDRLVPVHVFNNFQQARDGIALNNQYALQELIALLKLFRAHGISAIEMKGLTLGVDLYQDAWFRVVGDLDILIDPKDLRLVETLLFKEGYTLFAGYLGEDLFRKRASVEAYNHWCKQHHYNVQYIRREGVSFVEIHWHLVAPAYQAHFDIEKIWSKARVIEYEGLSLWTLSREDTLLYVSLHAGFNDRLAIRLSDLRDIARAVTRYGTQLDWDRVAARAQVPVFRPFLYCVWSLVNRILNDPIPPRVLDKLRPGGVDDMVLELVENRMFREKHGFFSTTLNAQALFVPGSVWTKCAALLWAIFPDRKTLAKLYGTENDLLLPLCYVYRPFDLLVRYGRFFVQLFRARATSAVLDAKRNDAAIDKVVERWRRAGGERTVFS